MGQKSKPKSVVISPQAQKDIINILNYLQENWNQKVIDVFLGKLEAFYTIVSINPRMFRYYDKRINIRVYILTKQNSIYYRNKRASIEIITVFDTRQDPLKLKYITGNSK